MRGHTHIILYKSPLAPPAVAHPQRKSPLAPPAVVAPAGIAGTAGIAGASNIVCEDTHVSYYVSLLSHHPQSQRLQASQVSQARYQYSLRGHTYIILYKSPLAPPAGVAPAGIAGLAGIAGASNIVCEDTHISSYVSLLALSSPAMPAGAIKSPHALHATRSSARAGGSDQRANSLSLGEHSEHQAPDPHHKPPAAAAAALPVQGGACDFGSDASERSEKGGGGVGGGWRTVTRRVGDTATATRRQRQRR